MCLASTVPYFTRATLRSEGPPVKTNINLFQQRESIHKLPQYVPSESVSPQLFGAVQLLNVIPKRPNHRQSYIP